MCMCMCVSLCLFVWCRVTSCVARRCSLCFVCRFVTGRLLSVVLRYVVFCCLCSCVLLLLRAFGGYWSVCVCRIRCPCAVLLAGCLRDQVVFSLSSSSPLRPSHASMCPLKTSTCVRFGRTHGDVFEWTKGGFRRVTPHTKPQDTPQDRTQHKTPQTPHEDRDRETERERRQRKTREDKRREEGRETIHFQCGGAWPFSVDGVLCLVNSVNERDLSLLNSVKYDFLFDYFLEGLCVSNARKFEAITGL